MQLEVTGAKLSYEVSGNGKWLVLVHGHGDNQAAWYNQVPVFSQQYKVLTFDCRGHGQTEVTDGDYSTDACIADLHNLLNSLNVDTAVLLGYSMGAGIALEYAIQHPNKVRALILANGGTIRNQSLEEMRQADERRRAQNEAIRNNGLAATFNDRLTTIFSPGFPERAPAVVEKYREIYLANDSAKYLARAQAVSPRPPVDYSRVSCPTLIIAGERDGFFSAEAAVATQKAIANCQLKVFPTGHATAMEDPEGFNASVLNFLEEVSVSEQHSLMQVIMQRRSIRRFTDQPITDEAMDQILEAGRLAPSWANRQCLKIIVVRDQAAKAALSEFSSPREYYGEITSPDYRGNPAQRGIAQAQVVLVLCANPEQSGKIRGMEYYLLDIGIIAQNIMLMAASLGIGTCYVGVFNEAKVKELLGVPDDIRVVGLMPMGYPDRMPEPRPRRALDDIRVTERWQ